MWFSTFYSFMEITGIIVLSSGDRPGGGSPTFPGGSRFVHDEK